MHCSSSARTATSRYGKQGNRIYTIIRPLVVFAMYIYPSFLRTHHVPPPIYQHNRANMTCTTHTQHAIVNHQLKINNTCRRTAPRSCVGPWPPSSTPSRRAGKQADRWWVYDCCRGGRSISRSVPLLGSPASNQLTPPQINKQLVGLHLRRRARRPRPRRRRHPAPGGGTRYV